MLLDTKTLSLCPFCQYVLKNSNWVTQTELLSLHDPSQPLTTLTIPNILLSLLDSFNLVWDEGGPKKQDMEKAGITYTLLSNHMPSRPTKGQTAQWIESRAQAIFDHIKADAARDLKASKWHSKFEEWGMGDFQWRANSRARQVVDKHRTKVLELAKMIFTKYINDHSRKEPCPENLP